MIRARRLDRECWALQRQGELTVYPPFEGQEAAQVGSAFALGPQDFAFPSFRELAAAVVRGVDVVEYLQYHRGTWHGGPYDPYASGFAPICVPLATQLLHAAAGRSARSWTARWPRARSRTSARAPRPRATSTRPRTSRPCSSSRSCSSARRTAGRSRCRSRARRPRRSSAAPRATGSPACGWMGTTCSRSSRRRVLHSSERGRAAAPPSSRPSRTGSGRTTPPTTPRATATRRRSSAGALGTRSRGSGRSFSPRA
jgi:hypothetical protein